MVAVNAGVRDQGGVTKEASILVARQTFPAKDVNDLRAPRTMTFFSSD
jgi:hypothetical protein